MQAAPNTGQAGVNWGDFFPTVINVGAYNVDQTGELLFHDADNYESIDIFADGYVRNEDWPEETWNFGTSFAAPRVYAEIYNLFEETIFPYYEQNPDEISYQNLSAAEEAAVTNTIVDEISTDVEVLFDGTVSFEYTLPVLTSHLDQSLYPTEVPYTYPNALPYTVTRVALTNTAPIVTTQSTLEITSKTGRQLIAFNATDADGDELTVSFTSPSKGVAIDNGDSTYSYVPATDAYGKDSFDIEVSDGNLTSSQTVEVVIIEKIFNVNVAASASGSGNKYYIDGAEAPELTLKQGHIYQFDLSDPSTSNHPMSFSESTSASLI